MMLFNEAQMTQLKLAAIEIELIKLQAEREVVAFHRADTFNLRFNVIKAQVHALNDEATKLVNLLVDARNSI